MPYVDKNLAQVVEEAQAELELLREKYRRWSMGRTTGAAGLTALAKTPPFPMPPRGLAEYQVPVPVMAKKVNKSKLQIGRGTHFNNAVALLTLARSVADLLGCEAYCAELAVVIDRMCGPVSTALFGKPADLEDICHGLNPPAAAGGDGQTEPPP